MEKVEVIVERGFGADKRIDKKSNFYTVSLVIDGQEVDSRSCYGQQEMTTAVAEIKNQYKHQAKVEVKFSK